MTTEEIQLLKRRTTFRYFSAFEKKNSDFFPISRKIFRFFNSPSGNPAPRSSSSHKFSMGLKSGEDGDWGGGAVWILFLFNQFLINPEVHWGLLSCMKMHCWPCLKRLVDGCRFSPYSKICPWYDSIKWREKCKNKSFYVHAVSRWSLLPL